jgi:hypothetical protein
VLHAALIILPTSTCFTSGAGSPRTWTAAWDAAAYPPSPSGPPPACTAYPPTRPCAPRRRGRERRRRRAAAARAHARRSLRSLRFDPLPALPAAHGQRPIPSIAPSGAKRSSSDHAGCPRLPRTYTDTPVAHRSHAHAERTLGTVVQIDLRAATLLAPSPGLVAGLFVNTSVYILGTCTPPPATLASLRSLPTAGAPLWKP